ncbi:hypothetical protein PVAND_003281 [Polypedilum vanderplanki]|uniref:CHK kinase-like domain-containing protein n=1 Tax=Polypedilum vanderplanki TaxID=319348 RepID=A0A9J6BTK4_POLVA|nr:hypothetical protein PVAND_003281 [Polypedilum vanderplanki]
MSDQNKILNFIRNKLPQLILNHNDDLKGHKIVNCDVKANTQLDGFMSSLYFLNITLENEHKSETVHQLIVKIMKGDQNLRAELNATALCMNEIKIYKDVIPYFKNFLKDSNVETFDCEKWVPKVYFADCKIVEELGDSEETILVMENLIPEGFRTGPRVDLNEDHLTLMAKCIASYHATSFAMRIKKDPMLEKLAEKLIPYSFLANDGSEPNVSKVFYKYRLERVFAYICSEEKFHSNKEFIEKVRKLKRIAYDCPLKFMEIFLVKDEIFSIILHGDYNRNNVLFKYDSEDGYNNPTDIRMIDFQEVRYASPAIDLSFFMYMNLPGELREELFDKLLEIYHKNLMTSLTDILKCSTNDPRLEPYNFENFMAHFSKNAFYGAMVAMVFIPMMACPEEECAKMIDLFDNDYESEELHKLNLTAGGRNVDERVSGILYHAFNKGFMDILK